MKYLFAMGFIVMLSACSGSGKAYHSIHVIKPVYHRGYYKDSRWHKKLQVGRIRIRWFEKQGVRSVKMKG